MRKNYGENIQSARIDFHVKKRGLFVLIFNHYLSNKGYKSEGHPTGRMAYSIPSLVRTPHKAFEKKVRLLFLR